MGLEVEMQDASVVRVVERSCDLHHDLRGAAWAQPANGKLFAKGTALQVVLRLD
jgi:hypothetical protein